MFKPEVFTDEELRMFYNTMRNAVYGLFDDDCADFCNKQCQHYHLCTWYHCKVDAAYNELIRREMR